MNDNEIIKALEYCNSTERGKCLNKCPYYDYSANCSQRMIDDALDLINRQKAEAERLNKKVEELSEVLSDSIKIKVSEIKSETIREFGKLLIDKSKNGVISISDIPDYVVEMVGENNV